MPKVSKRKYAINFDLSIKKLGEFYDNKHPRKAYRVIRQYMESNGFTHRQWSGYISDSMMTKAELLDFTFKLHEDFPWLVNCEGSMDATVVTEIFDIKQMILDNLEEDDNDMKL